MLKTLEVQMSVVPEDNNPDGNYVRRNVDSLNRILKDNLKCPDAIEGYEQELAQVTAFVKSMGLPCNALGAGGIALIILKLLRMQGYDIVIVPSDPGSN